MPMLFISYKRGDSAVEPIIRELRAAKYRVWFDKDNIVTGEHWRQSINTGIEQSAAVVVMLNPEACDSQYIKVELEMAREKNRPIFPVITHSVSTVDLNKLGLAGQSHLNKGSGKIGSKTVWRSNGTAERIGPGKSFCLIKRPESRENEEA